MSKLSVDEFEKKLALIPEEEPDEWDLEMLASIKAENDTSKGVPLEVVKARREYSGKISNVNNLSDQ